MTDAATTTDGAGRGRSPRCRLRDARGVAATIVLFPIFMALTFMMVQAIWWQNDRQLVAAAADRASAAVALYGSSGAEAETIARQRLEAAGLREISVSISGGADVTVVTISAAAPGLLGGTSITVSASATTSSERVQQL